jgi:hypothetical protein
LEACSRGAASTTVDGPGDDQAQSTIHSVSTSANAVARATRWRWRSFMVVASYAPRAGKRTHGRFAQTNAGHGSASTHGWRSRGALNPLHLPAAAFGCSARSKNANTSGSANCTTARCSRG